MKRKHSDARKKRGAGIKSGNNGLWVNINVLKQGLKDVPVEALRNITMEILKEQSVQKVFTLFVDNEVGSPNEIRINWVWVGKLIFESPDICVNVKIGLKGTDRILFCRLMIPPAYIPKSEHASFLVYVKEKARELFDKKRGDVKEERPEKSSPTSPASPKSDAPVGDSGEVVVFPLPSASADEISVPGTSLSMDEKKDGLGAQKPPRKSSVSRAGVHQGRNFKNVFHQVAINRFIALFIERAGGENLPLAPHDVMLIFNQMEIDSKRLKGALHHLVLQDYVNRVASLDRDAINPVLIWLTTKAREYHALQLVKERDGDPIFVIADLRRENTLRALEINALKEDLQQAREATVSGAISADLVEETLRAIKKKCTTGKREALFGILSMIQRKNLE